MTSPLSNVKVEQLRISRVPIDVTKTYNLGDNLKWDPVHSLAVPVVAGDAASASAAYYYIGVALDQQPIYSLNENLPFAQMNVLVKGLVQFTVDDNSTYYPGSPVTFGAGPQLVRLCSQSGSTVIGVVATENNFAVASGSTTGIVATALVTKLLIYIKPAYTQLTSW